MTRSTANLARGDQHWTRRTPDRLKRGVRHGGAKLTESDVREIRRRRAAGEKLQDIADDYCICHTNVVRIALRKSWKHVQDQEAAE